MSAIVEQSNPLSELGLSNPVVASFRRAVPPPVAEGSGMANATRTLAGVLGVVMLTASPAWAQSALRIAVHIEDHAGLNRDGLYTAQKLVSEVYEAIGIDLVWVDRQGATESGRGREASLSVVGCCSRLRWPRGRYVLRAVAPGGSWARPSPAARSRLRL